MRLVRPTLRSALAASAALVCLGLLTGCAGNPVEGLVRQGVEDAVGGAVEEATGGDVSLSGELPADFPASVPVIDGEIQLTGGADAGRGWVVVLTSDAADPLGEARAALEAGGFAEQAAGTVEQVAPGALFSDGEFLVVLAGEGSTVTYTVTPLQ